MATNSENAEPRKTTQLQSLLTSTDLEFMLEAHTQAYSEDVEALEWINEVVRTDGEEQFDLSFAPDKPGLMARRVMYRLAMAEQG